MSFDSIICGLKETQITLIYHTYLTLPYLTLPMVFVRWFFHSKGVFDFKSHSAKESLLIDRVVCLPIDGLIFVFVCLFSNLETLSPELKRSNTVVTRFSNFSTMS